MQTLQAILDLSKFGLLTTDTDHNDLSSPAYLRIDIDRPSESATEQNSPLLNTQSTTRSLGFPP